MCDNLIGWGKAGMGLFTLKFSHISPVSLGHVCHAAFGVVSSLDGDGIVKSPPHLAVQLLLSPSRGEVELFHGENGPLSRGMDQGLPVHLVVQQKSLLGIPAAEVGAQQGKNLILRGDLSHQDSLQF